VAGRSGEAQKPEPACIMPPGFRVSDGGKGRGSQTESDKDGKAYFSMNLRNSKSGHAQSWMGSPISKVTPSAESLVISM
jgi:hypothetical protein